MQKGRNVQYVTAGVQAVPGIRMNVRSNVRLPDSEAGQAWSQERQPYYAGQVQRPSRQAPAIPARAAALFLAGLLVFFGFLVVLKSSQRAELTKRISAMDESIQQTEKQNEELKKELSDARDYARISYAASQNLGMISSEGVQAVRIMAPDTRPYETAAAQTENSPHSVLGRTMTGSR